MTTALLSALLLGGAALLTAVWNAWSNWQERKERREKQQGEVTLTDRQAEQVAAQAASLNTADIIKIGQLWQEQFNAVRAELSIEQRWRKRVTKYIRRHQPWDEEMERIAKENNWPISAAPRIDLTGEDDDDEDPMDQHPWHQ